GRVRNDNSHERYHRLAGGCRYCGEARRTEGRRKEDGAKEHGQEVRCAQDCRKEIAREDGERFNEWHDCSRVCCFSRYGSEAPGAKDIALRWSQVGFEVRNENRVPARCEVCSGHLRFRCAGEQSRREVGKKAGSKECLVKLAA